MNLMADQGVEGTSVAEVVNAAQSSVGSFYARFEGKDDFVGYLEARVWADATQRWDRAVADIEGRQLTAQDLVKGVVRLLIDTREADLGRRRVLGTASGSDSHAAAFHAHVLSGILDLLRPYRSEFHHPQPERAVRIAYAVLAGALDRLPQLRSAAGGSPDLVDEMARMFLAYLGSDPARGAIRRVEAGMPATVEPELAPTGPVTPHLPAVAETPPAPAVVESLPVMPMVPEPPPPAAVTLAQGPPVPMTPAVGSETGQAGPSSGASPTLEAGAPTPEAASEPMHEEPEEERGERERVDFFDVWG